MALVEYKDENTAFTNERLGERMRVRCKTSLLVLQGKYDILNYLESDTRPVYAFMGRVATHSSERRSRIKL